MKPYLVGLFAFLKVIDVYVTWLDLKREDNSEGNPVWRKIMALVGMTPALVIDFALIVGLVAVFSPQLPVWLLVGICVFQAIVDYNNVQIYRGGKGLF